MRDRCSLIDCRDSLRRLTGAAPAFATGVLVGVAAGPALGSNIPGSSSATWVGGTGDWSNLASWDFKHSLESSYLEVYIDGGNASGSHVRLDEGSRLDGLRIDANDALTLGAGNSLLFAGGPSGSQLENFGSIAFEAAGPAARLVVSYGGELLLEGGGHILLKHPLHSTIVGDAPNSALVNADNIISGAGRLGAGTLRLRNSGAIDANAQWLTLTIEPSDGGMVNEALMQARLGGRLRLLNAAIDNTGGSIIAHQGSRIDLDDASIIGGLLATSGDGLIRAMSAPAALEDLTLQASFELGSTQLSLKGQIINQGLISAVAGETLDGPAHSEIILAPGSGAVSLLGPGAIQMRTTRIHSGAAQYGGRLIHGPDHTMSGDASIGLNTVALTNLGMIVADRPTAIVIDPPPGQAMINHGTMRATGAGGFVFTNGDFHNSGTLEVRGGSRAIYTSGATLDNVANGALTGGTWRIIADESPAFIQVVVSTVFINEADVTLSGPDSSFPLINPLIANVGRFEIRNGRDFITTGPEFANYGELAIGPASTFFSTTDFLQEPSGKLVVELNGGGGAQDPHAAPLAVNGAAILSGTLEVVPPPGFTPHDATAITIIEADQISGEFDAVIAPPGLTAVYTGHHVILTPAGTCAGDLNWSGSVNVQDLLALIAQWGTCPQSCSGDLNDDGAVGVADLLTVMSLWGACP